MLTCWWSPQDVAGSSRKLQKVDGGLRFSRSHQRCHYFKWQTGRCVCRQITEIRLNAALKKLHREERGLIHLSDDFLFLSFCSDLLCVCVGCGGGGGGRSVTVTLSWICQCCDIQAADQARVRGRMGKQREGLLFSFLYNAIERRSLSKSQKTLIRGQSGANVLADGSAVETGGEDNDPFSRHDSELFMPIDWDGYFYIMLASAAKLLSRHAQVLLRRFLFSLCLPLVEMEGQHQSEARSLWTFLLFPFGFSGFSHHYLLTF